MGMAQSSQASAIVDVAPRTASYAYSATSDT